VNTDAEKTGWARRYRKALSRHLLLGPKSSLRPAHELGRQAAALGLETLDVAGIHEQALIALAEPGGSPRSRQRTIRRAKVFFAEAIVPIERTHAAALKAAARADQLTRTLSRRTLEASAAERDLQLGLVRGRAAEAALKESGKQRSRLRRESLRLQDRLSRQTRALLSRQETERRENSLRLQNEVAQTLVAINIRMLALKEAARANTENFKREIDETKALVKKSEQTIARLAHEIGSRKK